MRKFRGYLINKDKLIVSVTIIILLVTLLLKYTSRLEETDIWFQMAYGRYFLEHHTLIPDHTVFSWSQSDGSQIYCAWISQIILYAVYKIGGMSLMFAFRYLCLMLFLFFVWIHAKRNRVTHHIITWCICLVGSIMIQFGLQLRPEIFSFVLMTLMVWTWWEIKTSHDNGWLYCYLLPVILLIWMNTHGGVIFGMIFLGSLFMGEVLNGLISREEMLHEKTRNNFFISIFLCFITLFITPYGYKYPLALVQDLIVRSESSLQGLQNFRAYQNIFFQEVRMLHFVEYLCVSLLILFILLWPKIRDRRIDWALIITNIIFCFLYMKFLRILSIGR